MTSSFQNELNHLFSLTGFYFKSKIIDDSYKVKNNMLTICIFNKLKITTNFILKK